MWTTGNEIYISFTDGIRRTSQSIITKEKFVRLWNEWALPEWMKSNLSIKEGVELTEKQIEDLQSLLVHTDGITYSPIEPTSTNLYLLPDGTGAYPSFKRVLRVNFRFSSNGDWIKSYPLRSIDESFVLNSEYSAPSLTLLYHRTRAGYIQAVTPTGYSTTHMNLMYIREPNLMGYSLPDITYTIDLKQEQLEEIRDIAVRLYLERVKDPRWQSFLQEEMLKNVISK